MKKFYSFLISLGIFLFSISPIFAADDYHLSDQRQLEGGGCITVYSGYYRNQTLHVTHNVLTMVGFKMKNMNGGNVNVTVKDETTGETVVSANQRMGSGEGWMEFDFVNDALGYVVNTSHTFSIWVGTDYYSGTDAPCWIYTSTNNYDYGTRRQGSTVQSGDMTFYTTGYTIDMGRENPEPPEDEDPDTPEDETVIVIDDTTEDTSNSNDSTVVPENVPDESQSAEDVTVGTIDDSVTAPTLNNVIVDDILVELEDNTAVVESDDLVKITGTADIGDTVLVFIGDSVYTAVADEDSNWFVVVTFNEDSTVYAQSTNDEDKASEKVELFTTSILAASTENTDEEVLVEEAWYIKLWNLIPDGPWGYVIYAVIGFFFLGLILLLIILIKRRKGKEEKKEKSNIIE